MMSTENPPATPPRLSFSEPEPQVNARFTATPVDSPRFTFRNLVRSGSAGASPTPSRRTPRSSWGSRAAATYMEADVSTRSPRMCMHGATCVKVCSCQFAVYHFSFRLPSSFRIPHRFCIFISVVFLCICTCFTHARCDQMIRTYYLNLQYIIHMNYASGWLLMRAKFSYPYFCFCMISLPAVTLVLLTRKF